MSTQTGFVNHFLSLSLSVLALAAVGCDQAVEPVDAAQPRSGELQDAACPAGRQVARTVANVDDCPTVQGWQESPVFADGTGGLARYCSYTWQGFPGQQNEEVLLSHPELDAVGPDCEVVFEEALPEPEGDALWQLFGPDVEKLFHEGINRATAADLALPSTESSRWPVVVAVVDSVPEPAPATPRSEHGERMVSLIEDIACPDAGASSCAVDTYRMLGLPRWGSGQVDPVNGGYYGSQLDLAQAIYDAVETWRDQPWGAQVPKMIINLSVGWDPEFGEQATDTPAVEAVYRALQYASCNGVLVMSAAGNEGHLCSTGPLLPAAWMQDGPPPSWMCSALGAPSAPGDSKALVNAVGGLDHNLDPMPGSREAGMPRLAALASHAVAGGDSTALTGTSVSSGVASGAAALVWSYNPHLSPMEVFGALYVDGQPTGMTADFLAPKVGSNDVRGIDVCAALEWACNRPGSSCPFTGPLPCLGATPTVTVADLLAAAAASEAVGFAPTFGEGLACPACCGYPATAHSAAGFSGDPCPEPIDPALPYNEPQPTQVGCPNCTLDVTTAMVHASLDPSYAESTVLDAMVTVFDGASYTYFRLGAVTLSDQNITRIALDPGLMPSTVVSASIALTFDTEPRPVEDDLLIE